MTTINQHTNLGLLSRKIQERVRNASTLEQAAQGFMDVVFQEFEETIVLCRTFVTVPYSQLPPFNKVFVARLAQTKAITSLLKDHTPVLSLAGTRGAHSNWNDRRKSKNHVGIPLVSARFIEDIPMMSRLLNEVGLDLDWIEKGDVAGIEKAFGGLRTELFHVADAQVDVDNKGRRIISAQDFVRAYSVKTVFGFGSRFITSQTFMTSLFFTTEVVEKVKARGYSALIGSFKSAVSDLVRDGKIFDQ